MALQIVRFSIFMSLSLCYFATLGDATKLQGQNPKTIYMLWLQGYSLAPPLVHVCAESWKQQNPTWAFVFLDKLSVETYVDDSVFRYRNVLNKQHYADIIRINLLKNYGGIWADSSTLCLHPLDDWVLPRLDATHFFAFSFPIPDFTISNWFLYSSAPPNNAIVSRLDEEIQLYLDSLLDEEGAHYLMHRPAMKGEGCIPYFWFHNLFNRLVQTSDEFRLEWVKMPTVSCDSATQQGPHAMVPYESRTQIKDKDILKDIFSSTLCLKLSVSQKVDILLTPAIEYFVNELHLRQYEGKGALNNETRNITTRDHRHHIPLKVHSHRSALCRYVGFVCP